MPIEIRFCPLCGHSESDQFDQHYFRSILVTNRICRHCGLVFESPRMTEDELDEFYKSDYRRLYQEDQDDLMAKDIEVERERAKVFVKFVTQKIEKVGRHLEIGSSAGFLLLGIRERYGCISVGVEPDHTFRDYAVEQGLMIYPSLDVLRRKEEGAFDLISMSHVLEHMPDPVEYLTNLRRNYLTQNGWLFLEVPNLYGHDCFDVAHLVSFSPHSLDQVLQKAGFGIVQMVKHGRPRTKLSPYYLNVIAQPVGDTGKEFQVVPERGVGLKRRLGLLQRDLIAIAYRLFLFFRRAAARPDRLIRR